MGAGGGAAISQIQVKLVGKFVDIFNNFNSKTSDSRMNHVLLIYTSPFRLYFSVDDQDSIFTFSVFELTIGYDQAYAFLWITKFQSGQVNPKSYFLSLATKVWVCLYH